MLKGGPSTSSAFPKLTANNTPSWRSEDQLHYVQSPTIEKIIAKYYSKLIGIVEDTYANFYEGSSVNPDTYSLSFPTKPASRINALPSYVGGATDVAGMKWVASFPDNVANNKQRASAIIVINSFETGYPLAVVDGTKISAARTVASAMLAANKTNPERSVQQVSLHGAGLIHRELVTLMLQNGWNVERFVIHDPNEGSCNSLLRFCSDHGQEAVIDRRGDKSTESEIVSFATSALEPWYDKEIGSHQLVLHMSLRDILPTRLERTLNIVDHIPHALKANTSLHLLDQSERPYHIDDFRFFDKYKPNRNKGTVVSAFGMGMLDIAVAVFILDVAEHEKKLLAISQLRSSDHRW